MKAMNEEGVMAEKKGKKGAKPMGKKSMKKTKGGAVDMFLKISSPTATKGLNFTAPSPGQFDVFHK